MSWKTDDSLMVRKTLPKLNSSSLPLKYVIALEECLQQSMGGIDITGPGNKIIKLADPMRNQYVIDIGGVLLIVDEHWISKPRHRLKLRFGSAERFPVVIPLQLHIFTTSNECMFILNTSEYPPGRGSVMVDKRNKHLTYKSI
jgi:hypothetical protein